jgi:hypothetical protein
MSALQPFSPHYGTNQVVTPAAGSATIIIDGQDKQVRVVNTGAAKGYFRVFSITAIPGGSAATVADCCVASGGTAIVTKAEGQDRLSHISAAGTTFEVMTGEGWA